jgi:alpha-L-fucosidase
MTSRREFFQLATRTAVAAKLASNHGAAREQNDTQHATPRRGLPLQDLQLRFVDLRFGMVLP